MFCKRGFLTDSYHLKKQSIFLVAAEINSISSRNVCQDLLCTMVILHLQNNAFDVQSNFCIQVYNDKLTFQCVERH